MDNALAKINAEVYNKCDLEISELKFETESKEYAACQYKLNGRNIISRDAKVTPKKNGQFVTFWKRNGNGPIEPFSETDAFNYFVVNVRKGNESGQFVFPKSILIDKGILSSEKKEGKRGFRVYPIWDNVQSKQALQTQKWQLNYFFEINEITAFTRVSKLYTAE